MIELEQDYVLGTHNAEQMRLGNQHRIWRSRALEAWHAGGFARGQTILDVGCGPGFASLDLAAIVGPSGRVIAIDRSRTFLASLEASCATAGIRNVAPIALDIEQSEIPIRDADGAWLRWVLCFLKRPRWVLERVAESLRPAGTLVIHEYFDYGTWRTAPSCAEVEEFVRIVMALWRAHGGEPDIGLELPRWLDDIGFEIRRVRPIIDIFNATDPSWQWLTSFAEINLPRLVEQGALSEPRAGELASSFRALASAPGTFMIAPSVMEIVAERR